MINHCSSFQAPGSPDPRPGSWLSIIQKILSASSPSLIYGNEGKSQHFILRKGLLHANKGLLVKRIGSGFDTIFKKERKKEKEKKMKEKKSFWMRWWNPQGFQKPTVACCLELEEKRTRMPLIEQMLWNFYYVYLHRLKNPLLINQVNHKMTYNRLTSTLGTERLTIFYCNDQEFLLILVKKGLELWTRLMFLRRGLPINTLFHFTL